MRAGLGRPALNENLNPLRRFLRAQIGRPWNKVHAEISAGIDRRNTVQRHIFSHLDDMIAVQVEWRHGRWVNLQEQPRWPLHDDDSLRQELFVDPRTGLVRRNRMYESRGARYRAHWKAKRDAIENRRLRIDRETLLLKLAGEWYEVRVATLPRAATSQDMHKGQPRRPTETPSVFDVVLKRMVSRREGSYERQDLYGAEYDYAFKKRQLSRREMAAYQLPRN
jgi:hypothetical protein